MKTYVSYLLMLLAFGASAQDIHFSQIQEAPLWLNPANAGFFNGYFRAVANYRNQWAAMGNAYQTMALSIDGNALKVRKNKAYAGLGLFIFNDKAGVAKIGTTQAQLHANAIVKASKNSKIAGGIYLGVNQNSATYAALTYGNQYNGKEIDQSLATGEIVNYTSFVNSDVGAGLNYEYSSATSDMTRDDSFSLKVGAAVHHINRPVQRFSTGSTYRVPMRFVGNVQARIDIRDTKLSLLPSLVYLQQASAMEIIAGTHLRFRFKNGTKLTGNRTEAGLNVGVYYRFNDAIVPQVNLDMGKYAIGVSYDYNISRFSQVSKGMGGFEVYLKFMTLDDALFKRKREHGLN
jgi:type IX secretion system PorP/SprF family membrane protein